MKTLLILCAFLLSLDPTAQAAPRVRKLAPASSSPPLVAMENPEPKEPPTEWKWSLGANLDVQGLYYPGKVSPHVNDALEIGKGELISSLKVGRAFLAKFRPTGTWDPANKSESEQYWADVPEGYVQLRLPLGSSITSYTQVGFNVFTWGITDGFNPVDVVNARRYHDPLRSEKLGAFSVVEKVDLGSALVEGIFIPWQRESKLPGSSSRWLPRELSRDQQIESTLFRLPTTHTFYFREHQELDDALTANFGLRLGVKTLGIDFGGYFFDGASAVPATNLRLTGAVSGFFPGQVPDVVIDADPPIGIRPIYYRNKMYGASMVFPVWRFLVRMEGAQTKPDRKAVNLPVKTTEAVLELEYTFSGETQSLTIINLFTYADTEDPENTRSSTSFARMFDRGLALGLRYQPMEKLSAEFFSIFDTRYGGMLQKLESTYTLTDAWKVYGGAEVFSGKITTPIGVYRKNDRLWAGVKRAL